MANTAETRRDKSNVNTPEGDKSIIEKNMLIDKSRLSLKFGVANALTHAGVGEFEFNVAGKQVDPKTGKTLGEDSPFIVVTYTGQPNTESLFRLIDRTVQFERNLKDLRVPQEEKAPRVHKFIADGVSLELSRKRNT